MESGISDPIIFDGWDRIWRPRDRRPIYEKAKTRIFLPSRLTRTGWFDVESSRQLIAIFDALQNDRVREVSVLAPVRDGKSLVGDVWLPDLILDNPGPFRWVFGDDKQAWDHEDERIKPILSMIPELCRFIPKGRIGDIAGMPVSIDGPSLGNLQARGYKYMILDEPWMWPPGRLHEAKERQKDFRKLGSNKLLCISQGGSEKCDDWLHQFNSGVVHEWHVQCQGCGKYQIPVWSGKRDDGSRYGMRWDEHREQNGLWNAPKAATTARYECFHCGHAHVDTPLLKSRWNQTGKYIAETAEKNDTKLSFHWNAIPTYFFSELVELYLNAINQLKHGSPKALIVFFQKQMAEFATEHSIFQQQRNFRQQTVEITSDWPEEDGRIGSIDMQEGGLFYVTIRAWSARARQCRRIYRGVVHGEDGLIQIFKKHNVPPNHVIGDAGDDPFGPGGMYAMAVRNGWLCAKGVGTAEGKRNAEIYKTTVVNGRSVRIQSVCGDITWKDPGTGISGRAPLFRFDSDAIADLMDGLIKTGFWVEPPDDGSREEADYRKQMSAEYKDEDGKRHAAKKNHFYDCGKMNTAGAVNKGWIRDPMDNQPTSNRN